MSERVVEPGAWTTQGGVGGDGTGTEPRSPVDEPAGLATVTVDRSLEGVATAVSHLSAAHGTTGPERSHPSWRDHPPLVAFGDETDVPADVRDATPDTGITLRLPDAPEYLLVGAPLAYYLGAEVTVDGDDVPALVAPSAGVSRRLDPLPAFEETAADLLRRCFFLDTLVRDVESEALAGREHVRDELGIDARALRAATPAERLRTYLSFPPALDDALPEWHLSTYVEPVLSRARSLPHLLDSLSLVYLPEASELDSRERLERSLDDFYRATTGAPSVDVLSPRLQDGALHAWLADGTPIEAYKTSHAAYRNRLWYRADERETRNVAVVLNDESMAAERSVADIYRERAAVPVEVTLHESLRRDELARVFERPHDFVHYIGHCDAEGLRCSDGNLAAADLDRVRTRTFFLNACGSYHEGRALVENGSAAGAVTLTSVLDEQAATVGTTFARLLVEGYSVAGALQLARRRIMMGKDYAVVGDGTCAVVPGAEPPALLRVSDAGPDQFRVSYEVSATRSPGDSYRCPLDGDTYLQGVPAATTLDRASFVSFLRERSLPTVHDGEFAWSAELAADLDPAE